MASPDSPLLRFRLWRAGLPAALRLLLTLNVVTYTTWVLLSIFGLGGVLVDVLALHPGRVTVRPWTALTYSFSSVGPHFGGLFGLISFVFAVAWLSWMGRDYEERYGGAGLFGVYVMGALAGATIALLTSAFLPSFFAGAPWAGAWGGVAAVLCATAVLHPEKSIALLFLGVVPIRWIAIGFVVLDLAFVRDPSHLGAAAMGALVGLVQRSGVDLTVWAKPIFERRQRSARPVTTARPSVRARRTVQPEVPDARSRSAGPPRRRQGATQAEVDRILDKISERGIASLSDDERRVLDEYSRRS
jgi:membrane associated rhomboid family serine protease